MMFSYRQALEAVIGKLQAIARTPATESIPLSEAVFRVLARDILSDRDYPPFDRSIRDGYAVRSADTRPGASLRCIGELKAGDSPSIAVTPGACMQIMTGAALPEGADAVIMIEHTSRERDTVHLDRAVKPGQHVVRRGSEQAAGQTVLSAGTRIGFAEIAAAAQVGAANPVVTRKPRIAILSTGDEVVDFASTPGPFQIRNSNSVSLAAQVGLTGGEPVVLGNARDSLDDLRAKITAGLEADALILSGGVSMGKYDLVEPVLSEFAAEVIFDAVAIRPGKPVVFALCKGKPVFGLPGNPVSTMVTFDLFVRPAIDILSGTEPRPLPFIEATLTASLSEKAGLTHFLPAKLTWRSDKAHVSSVPWQGSGDVVAMAHANCLLVVPADRETIEAGEHVHVLPRDF
ncbi:MAG: molybdopterin molybdenumtransferase MoeA [Acidobacteria bacterium]|jgi:molybdopterin molybdotransferase|nr:MAG: molybdopterin molybdenumtransferase MoeA [Acidobacteriota bacterium]